jgi:hypothetical protein
MPVARQRDAYVRPAALDVIDCWHRRRIKAAAALTIRPFSDQAEGVWNVFIVEELSKVISQATAPAFLLGANAAFVNVLVGRLNRITDRGAALTAAAEAEPPDEKSRALIPRLQSRAKLISSAIQFAVISGIFTTLLVIVAFGCAALGISHEYGAAVLFVLALGFFAAALVYLLLEARIAIFTLEQFL